MKKVLYLVFCLFLLLGVAGCGKEEKSDNKKNDVNENNVKNEGVIESEKVVKEETYLCEQTDDDDITYTFFYKDDVLTKVELFTIYLDVYEDVKEEEDNPDYKGVSVNKTNEGVLVEVDLLNGGSTYLFDETFLYESQDKDLSWESVSEIAKNSYLTCKLK